MTKIVDANSDISINILDVSGPSKPTNTDRMRMDINNHNPINYKKLFLNSFEGQWGYFCVMKTAGAELGHS